MTGYTGRRFASKQDADAPGTGSNFTFVPGIIGYRSEGGGEACGLGLATRPGTMRDLALTVGVLLFLSGPARAGQPVPQPKAPLTTRGYKVPVTVVKSAPKTKTYVAPSVLSKKTITVPVKVALPKTLTPIHTAIQATQVNKPPVTVTTPRPITRVAHIKVRTLASPGHGSSISLLKAALLSGSTLGTPAGRRAFRVERRIQVRLPTRPRTVQHEMSPQPSLLRTLQYQFDLVQMSEALGQ